MLDLQILGTMLDEVLSKESSESLTAWLMEQRWGHLRACLGAGEFDLKTEYKADVISVEPVYCIDFQMKKGAMDVNDNLNPPTDLALAA